MILSCWRSLSITLSIFCLALLAGCGGDTQKAQTAPKPTPSPILTQGQQILAQTADALNSAKTLQGVFNLTITGQAINGTLNTHVWNAAPAKNRTEVRQSTLSQVPTGTVNVTDGKKVWQYDPVKNVVYSGPAQSTNTGTGGFGSAGNGQGQFVVTLVQNVFTHSDGTLKSSTSTVNGHAVYDIGVVPQSGAATGSNTFSYSGDVYVDKETHLPIRINLNIQGLGAVLLDLPQLTLNQPVPDTTFTFATPTGAKELPLQQATQAAGGDLIPLAQAQQQADFHLLSIPGNQTDYVLQGVNILGAPGNQIYTLHYMKGSTNFTIAQGKPLANISTSGGQQISLRSTTAFLSSQNGNNVLTWTEQSAGINITGSLSNNQLVAIAKTLA